MNEVIVNYDIKDKIIIHDGVKYVPKDIFDDVVADRRNLAIEHAKLIKDFEDFKKSVKNAKNEISRVKSKDSVRLNQEKEKPLEEKIYPNWAFEIKKEEKAKINRKIYEKLINEHKISYDERNVVNPLFDVVISVVFKPYCREYLVLKNDKKLSADEIALIVDNGNLCFGYTGDAKSGKVWID